MSDLGATNVFAVIQCWGLWRLFEWQWRNDCFCDTFWDDPTRCKVSPEMDPASLPMFPLVLLILRKQRSYCKSSIVEENRNGAARSTLALFNSRWAEVAAALNQATIGTPERTPSQCYQHFRRVSNPSINKGPWTLGTMGVGIVHL